jgi:hypothetical protein
MGWLYQFSEAMSPIAKPAMIVKWMLLSPLQCSTPSTTSRITRVPLITGTSCKDAPGCSIRSKRKLPDGGGAVKVELISNRLYAASGESPAVALH